jgi:AraC family transcriptional regulator
MTRLRSHGKAKYITGERLDSSHDRGWRGLLAERWRHEEGDLGEVRPRDTEIVVLIEGNLRVRRRGEGPVQLHEAAPGTVWLCPAGIREDMIHLYGDIRESLHMYLPAAPLSSTALQELDLDPDDLRLRYDGGFRDPLIEQIALAVRRELAEAGPGDRLLVESLSAALAVQILRNHSGRSAAALPLPAAAGALAPRRLGRVQDYVEANLDRELTLDALAGEACLSPHHFARAFKAATGTAPHRYVTERRVARAKRLLGESRLPLAEIALACGFSSQAHLTRRFKQATGITPGTYRAELVGAAPALG